MYKFLFFLVRGNATHVTIRVLQASTSIFYTHDFFFVWFGIYFRYLLTQKINPK